MDSPFHRHTSVSPQASPNGSKLGRAALKARVTFFAMIGVTGLLVRDSYAGPWRETVHNWGGNLSVSFAMYFVMSAACFQYGFGRLAAAGAALAAVELFEALDGFGIMQNVYDPIDFAANAVGVVLALAIDAVTSRRISG